MQAAMDETSSRPDNVPGLPDEIPNQKRGKPELTEVHLHKIKNVAATLGDVEVTFNKAEGYAELVTKDGTEIARVMCIDNTHGAYQTIVYPLEDDPRFRLIPLLKVAGLLGVHHGRLGKKPDAT